MSFLRIGPVFGYLLDRLNFRKCALIGGVLMALGMVASSQVQNALQLCFTFGLLTGIIILVNFSQNCKLCWAFRIGFELGWGLRLTKYQA